MSAALVGRRIVLALWAGALWTGGFVVAPMLFATLADRQLAGMLAGELFTAVAWLSVACLLLLGVFEYALQGRMLLRRWTSALIFLALLLSLVGELGVRPLMAAAAEAGDSARFDLLHNVSASLYLTTSAIALALVAWREPGARGD